MLNKDGVTKTTYGAPRQILANVDLQASVGCVVSHTLGVTVGSKKIAKAGTPIVVNFGNLLAPVTGPVAEVKGEGGAVTTAAVAANAVLLHDVDVTSGNANGTALYIGVVNINRLDTDVQAKVTAGVNAVGGVTFLKA